VKTWQGTNGIRAALSRREGTTTRTAQIAPGEFRVFGFVDLIGTGEVDVDVNFPVSFVDLPVITGSGIMAEGQSLVAGEYPIWNVGGASLVYDEKPGGSRLYRGARLAIVCSGHEGMLSTATWIAQGRALVNPARPSVEMMT
jgi:hypothetical protein